VSVFRQDQPNNQINQIDVPNALPIASYSDTGTVTLSYAFSQRRPQILIVKKWSLSLFLIPGTLLSIIEQAGLTKKEFTEILEKL
jgi:hypothetical protein